MQFAAPVLPAGDGRQTFMPSTSTAASTTVPSTITSTSSSTIDASTTSEPFAGWVHTTYSAALDSLSERYYRTHFNRSEQGAGHFYHAVTLSVSRHDTYTISSASQIDAYGYLYTRNFFVDKTSNGLIIQDDDGTGDRQFRLTYYLQANVTYFVVVTTYAKMVTGSYSLSAHGPAQFSFQAAEPTVIFTTTSESLTFLSVC